MDKMDCFIDFSLWEQAVAHGIDKKIDKALLEQICSPAGRWQIVQTIEEGNYTIEPPCIGKIPKDDGTYREVYINSGKDRLVLSVINEVYFKLFGNRIHPSCVSYQKGIGVGRIIKAISKRLPSIQPVHGNVLGYKADLSKYFDSVNKDTLFRALQELSDGSPLDKVIFEYYADDRIINENGEIVAHYKSLAQGCSLSAFLSNYVLRDIDEVLSNLDILYYRYSDDLLMLGKDADKAMELLKLMLAEKGLVLNPKKVKEIRQGEWFSFLGFNLKGSDITFSENKINKFKNKIREITKLRKGMKKHSRSEQRKAIKKINSFLYTAYFKKKENFGWAAFFFSTVNVREDIRMLDEFVKDHLKHMYTGKWNHTTNQHKTSNGDLQELGYISIVHMYEAYKTDRDVFNTIIRSNMI